MKIARFAIIASALTFAAMGIVNMGATAVSSLASTVTVTAHR